VRLDSTKNGEAGMGVACGDLEFAALASHNAGIHSSQPLSVQMD
jgi:hypothetical protein